MKLFMLLLGGKPKGRFTEQHDIFFGIGNNLKELVPAIKKSWPEADVHIDAWRQVNTVDGFAIQVEPIGIDQQAATDKKAYDLFFINLGGYKENEFEEFHYKMLVVADTLDNAKAKAKKTAFFKHSSVGRSVITPNATAHIDDKYGIDIDDTYSVKDILAAEWKDRYCIRITEEAAAAADDYHLGYFKLKDL